MEMLIHFNDLPQGLTLDAVKSDLAVLLEDDGWLTGSGEHHIEPQVRHPHGKGLSAKGQICPGHYHRAGGGAGGHL